MTMTTQRTIVWTATGVLLGAVLAVLVMTAWHAEASPGDDDATFVPISNCRLFDTRSPDGVGPKTTPLGPGEPNVYTQQVTGTNGNCTIPPGATGVAMNVTIVNPTAQSNLRVFPADVPTPLASNLNWLPGQSPTPNKVDVKLSGDGAIKLFNFRGTVDVLADVVGYYSNESLVELDNRVAELEALVADMSIEQVDGQRTVRFTGVNVQIVDGTGDTACGTNQTEACSGRGNVLIGYQEDTSDPADRSGVHNLVVGENHEYTSHSGAAIGSSHSISGEGASVSGGFNNTASGRGASVSGGSGNTASGRDSSVSGGRFNAAEDRTSSVSGGDQNSAVAPSASVSGGVNNTASGGSSSILGGNSNLAPGGASSVAGGYANVVNGRLEVIVGGDSIPFCIADGSFFEAAVCGEGTIGATD
ncbi:MAG: hypothetical protein AAGA42_09285 [Actinomycetota bacterium]